MTYEDVPEYGPAGHLESARGLEGYVRALCDLRRGYWPRFDARLRAVLMLADYYGLERALTLTIAELETKAQAELPGFIYRPVAAAFSTESRNAREAVCAGWSTATVIRDIQQAMIADKRSEEPT